MYRAAFALKSGHQRLLNGLFMQHGRFGIVIQQRLQPTSSTGPTSQSATQTAIATRVVQEPFLNGSSSIYVEEMYKAWLKDPNSVHKSWDIFFRVSETAEPGHAYRSPTMPAPTIASYPSLSGRTPTTQAEIRSAVTSSDSLRDIEDHLSVQAIIRSYQVCFFNPQYTQTDQIQIDPKTLHNQLMDDFLTKKKKRNYLCPTNITSTRANFFAQSDQIRFGCLLAVCVFGYR